VRIVNLMTQEPPKVAGQHPGKATIANVNHALRELRRFVEHEHIKSLALPRLATGVGGLKWQSVQPLLSQHLGELTIPIFLYTTYHPQQLADEQGKDGAWAKSLRPPQA
jgi:O-acetyl-ADP-ribose deacetylase (regulator of RNase III)